MDRGRDRRYEGRDRPIRTETYRPSERRPRSPPPRVDSYRAPSPPPRRGREPPLLDSYRSERGDEYPRDRQDRRRSRSPAARGRDDGYRGRVRSPPRAPSPRREVRVRSPLAPRRYSRSPYGGPGRDRSPLPQKRGREPTPPSTYRQRSPLSAKRERFTEPGREAYVRRGYSPPREPPGRVPRENNYRPRERSRTPPRLSAHASRGQSPVSSRRSSPPMHPDRMAISRSPVRGHPRAEPPYDEYRSREQSPPRRAYSPPPRSPPPEMSAYRERSPLPRKREPPRNGATPNTWSNSQMAPSSGPSHRNGEARPPPSGPGGSRYDGYSRDAPSGPPSAPISMSAHNRPSSAALLTAPTRPRGGPGFGRDNPRDAPYGGPPSSHRGGGRHYNAGPPRQSSYDPHSIPTGPRGNYNGPQAAPSYNDPPPRIPFRNNNSSSTTYPRTQRFSQHLSSLPSIVPGGKSLPSGLDPAQERRLQQLEDDKKKLLEAIEEKQRAKRQGLREWDKSEREGRREGLRSELAEGHLDRLSGEGGMSGGAY